MLAASIADSWLALPAPAQSPSPSLDIPVTLPLPSTSTAAPIATAVSFEGIPDEAAFEVALAEAISGRYSRKNLDTVVVTKEKHDAILTYLVCPTQSTYADSNERKRLSDYYRYGVILEGGEWQAVVEGRRNCSDKTAYKRVACREDFFRLITSAHLDGDQHRNLQETHAIIKQAWSELPHWATEVYIKLCPGCNSRRKAALEGQGRRQGRARTRLPAPAQLAPVAPTRGNKRANSDGGIGNAYDQPTGPSKRAKVAPTYSYRVPPRATHAPSTPTAATRRTVPLSPPPSACPAPQRKRARDDNRDDDLVRSLADSSPSKRARATAAHLVATPLGCTAPTAPLTPQSLPLDAAMKSDAPFEWPAFLEQAASVDSKGRVSINLDALLAAPNTPTSSDRASSYESGALDSPIRLLDSSTPSTLSADAASTPFSSRMSRTSSVDSNSSSWSAFSASSATSIASSCSNRTSFSELTMSPSPAATAPPAPRRSEATAPVPAILGATPPRARTIYASRRAVRPLACGAAHGPPQTPRSELSLYPVTPSSDPALGRIRAEPVALAPRAVAHTAARATAIPARLVDTLPRPASPLARRLTAQGESPGGARTVW